MIKKNYIIFSSIDWKENWQSNHELSKKLSNKKNNVLFVENLGSRDLKIGDFSRIITRLKNWIKSQSSFRKINKHLYLLTPIFIPLLYSKLARKINVFLVKNKIYSWINANNVSKEELIILTYLPTPLIKNLIQEIQFHSLIYYQSDNMVFNQEHNIDLKKSEEFFLKNADVVMYTASFSKNKIKNFRKKNIFFFPSAVDLKKFNYKIKSKKKINNRKTVGYIGSIRNILDKNLLEFCIKNLPNVNFVFVGPIYINIDELKKFKNVIFLGKKEHSEIPAYIKTFDVCLIPYLKNDYTKYVYPCKLNEYLSMGKKVISTDLDEVKGFNLRHGKIVEIANNKKVFLIRLKKLLEDKKNFNKKFINIAKINSWDERFKKFEVIISKLKNTKNFSLYQSFDFYINKKNKAKSFIYIVAVLTILVFFTPLVWFLGFPLTSGHMSLQENYKVITVFSGNGENSYINTSYQKRVKDLIELKKKQNIEKIILTSGKTQTFAEVTLMKSLLKNLDIPDNKIVLIEKYPRNTFENVEIVKKFVTENNINKFYVLTSPYHIKRLKLIFKKNIKNKEYLFIAPSDLKKFSEWKSARQSIKVILYEYAAIVYNFIRGWL